MSSRIERECKAIAVMISDYCRDHHSRTELCSECLELLNYALERLKRCPFQKRKTDCAKCRVHCYKPDMRAKIRLVMRYAGPRMIYRHPVLAILHVIDRGRQNQAIH